MGEDPRIVVLGEDVHRLNGGTNGATKGLAKKYPGRVLGTPISENAFAGLGGGIALDGRFRPVVEFMYPDFIWVAADQVFNQIGKARHMFGGLNPVPLVLRTKVAMGSGYGSQHLMDPAGIFATSPGWRIVAASTPYDYVGLMNAALALGDPVLMLEHVDLYGAEGEIPVDDLDYQIPFGQAAVRREGKDVTVLTYLSMVQHARQAIEQTGVDAELIDLRFLDRASLDWQTVGESIHKTNAVLIVEQGAQGTSYGGWLADEIQRRFFDWLDQPVQRVTGAEALKHLEGARTSGDRPHRRSRRRYHGQGLWLGQDRRHQYRTAATSNRPNESGEKLGMLLKLQPGAADVRHEHPLAVVGVAAAGAVHQQPVLHVGDRSGPPRRPRPRAGRTRAGSAG